MEGGGGCDFDGGEEKYKSRRVLQYIREIEGLTVASTETERQEKKRGERQ